MRKLCKNLSLKSIDIKNEFFNSKSENKLIKRIGIVIKWEVKISRRESIGWEEYIIFLG